MNKQKQNLFIFLTCFFLSLSLSLFSRRADALEKISAEKCNIGSFDFRKMGIEIITFELLQSRYYNVISLEQLMEQSTSAKGAVFVLYNVARLETILSHFNDNVQNGVYEELPQLKDIHFELLKEEVNPIDYSTLFNYNFIRNPFHNL